MYYRKHIDSVHFLLSCSICASRKGLARLPLNMSAEDVNHNDNGQAGGFNFSSTFKPWVDTSSIPPPKYNSTPLSPQASPTKGVPADKKKLKKVTRKGKWPYDNPSRAELWHGICLRKASSGQGIYDEVSKEMNLTNSETGEWFCLVFKIKVMFLHHLCSLFICFWGCLFVHV